MKKLKIPTLCTVVVLALTGCATTKLNTAAKVALVTEKSAAGGLRAIDDFAASETERCRAEQLATEAERAACIETALKAVQAGEVVGEQLQASLETFWIVWSTIKAKSESGLKPTADDWAALADVASNLQQQFETLKPHLKNLRK